MPFEPTQHFLLSNIRLRSSSFGSIDNIDEIKLDTIQTHIQTRKWAEHRFVSSDDILPIEHLKTIIHLGIRLVREDNPSNPASPAGASDEDDGAAITVLYFVEADFAVDFQVRDKSCSDEDLNKFVRANATHVAWPFWREHVFNTLRAASLPPLDVPLMARVKEPSSALHEQSTKETENL